MGLWNLSQLRCPACTLACPAVPRLCELKNNFYGLERFRSICAVLLCFLLFLILGLLLYLFWSGPRGSCG